MLGVGSFVERTKLKLAVDGACSTQDEPIQIYVLDELVQALAAGDARAGVEAVVARLQHRSPVVKQKALKLVAHIGRKGSPDLRRLMARHSGAVRDLLHFRCEPDEFKGDTVWKRVQEYAQEALNAIHGEPEAAQPQQSGLRGRIQGWGSEGAGGYGSSSSASGGMLGFGSESAGGYGGASSGRMVGFGSADVVQSGMQAISSGMRSLSGRRDGYSGTQLDSGSEFGGAGGRASGSSLVQGPIVQAGATALAPSSGAAAESGQPAAARGGSGGEQRLVDRICTPAGLRAAPSHDDLRAFVDGISSLDGPSVAQLLERKLDAGTWQTALRALCAIEAVVDSGSSAACGQVAVHFQAHPEAVRRAADSPQASVRQRAQKLLVLLGAAAPPAAGGGSSSGTSASQQPLFTEDLLGGADGAAPSSSPAAALKDLLGNGSSSAAGDLLSGLGGPPAAGAAPSSLQLVAEPAPAGTGSAVADDLFSGMLLEGQPASALPPPASPLDLLASLGGPPSAPASAPAPAPAGGLGDLLGELSLGPSPAPGGPGGQPLQQPLGGMGLQLGAAPLTSPQPVGTGMGHALPQAPALGSGGLPQALLGSGPVQHGRQPSLGMLGSGQVGALASSGIVDSSKDNAFNFVDDALAAARRK